jgi:regulatory protein
MSDNLHSDIYNKALDIISRREHSVKEVLNKLTRKFDADEVVESVIEKLISKNLINDSRFAEMYTSARKKKGFGPKRISYELSIKGVKEYIASGAIAEEGGWTESALSVFKKKYKNGPASDFKESMKQKTFLQNRGFTFKEIESVMRQDML